MNFNPESGQFLQDRFENLSKHVALVQGQVEVFFVDFLFDFLQPYTLLRSFVVHVLTLSHKKCLGERFFVVLYSTTSPPKNVTSPNK